MDSPSSQSTSRFGGPVGAALLVAVLFAIALGVYGAVYMDAFRPTSMQSTPQVASAPVPATPAPAVPTAVPPEVSVMPRAPVAVVNPPTVLAAPVPQAGPRIVTIPPADLTQINPAASRSTPAPIEAAKPPYWVEYGAYDGPRYARQLVGRLAAAGISAEIKQVHGLGGRRYYSVRSTATADRANAEGNIRLAAARIGIAPLLHRGGGAALAQPIAMKPLPDQPSASRTKYWVQFGAYNGTGYAIALRDRLSRAGVNVFIVKRTLPGQAHYLVRSPSSLGRDEARSLAARGQSLLGIKPLVGQAPNRSRPSI